MAYTSGSAYPYMYSLATHYGPDAVAELPGTEPAPNSCRSPSPVRDGEAQLLEFEVVYRAWRSWKLAACSDSSTPWSHTKCPMPSCDARFQPEDLVTMLRHVEIEFKALKHHAGSVCSQPQSCQAATPVFPTAGTESGPSQSRCSKCHSTWCRAKSLFKNNKTLGLGRISSLHDSLKKRRKTSPLPDGTSDREAGIPRRAWSAPPPYSESPLATGASSSGDVYSFGSKGPVQELLGSCTMPPLEVQAGEVALEMDAGPINPPVELPASFSTYHNVSSMSTVDYGVRDAPSKSFTSVSAMSEITASTHGRDSMLSEYSRPTVSSWSTTTSLSPICTTPVPVDSRGPIFTDALTLSPVETDDGERMEICSDSLLSGEPQVGPIPVASSPFGSDNGDKKVVSESLSGGPEAATTLMPLHLLDATKSQISSYHIMVDNLCAASNTMALFHVESNNRSISSEVLHNSNMEHTQHVPPGHSGVTTLPSSHVKVDNSIFSQSALSSNRQWTTETAVAAPRLAPELRYKCLPTRTASDISKSSPQPSFIQQDPVVQRTSHSFQKDPIVQTSHPGPTQSSSTTAPIQPSFTAPTMSASNLTFPTIPTAASSEPPTQVAEIPPAPTNIFVEKLESLKRAFSMARKSQANIDKVYANLPQLSDEVTLFGGLDTMEALLTQTPDDRTSMGTYRFCFAYLAIAMTNYIGRVVEKKFIDEVFEEFVRFVDNEGGVEFTSRFFHTISSYLRVLSPYAPTSLAGQPGHSEALGYDQEQQRQLQVFEMMKAYLHQNPSPRDESESASSTASAGAVVEPASAAAAATTTPDLPVARPPMPRTPRRPAASAPPTSPAPTPAPSRKRRRRAADEPVEVCCRPCGYYPEAGEAQQKKLARHRATIKHHRLMTEFGLATAASTPAADGTPSSATTTATSFAAENVPKHQCPLRLVDGTRCPRTFTRLDNMKMHMKKDLKLAHLVEEEEEEGEEEMPISVYGNFNLNFGAYGNGEGDRTSGKRVKYTHNVEDQDEEEEVDAMLVGVNDENQRPVELRYTDEGNPLIDFGFWSGW